MNKKKILWLSDSPLINTGYATISRNILNGLSDEYECHFLAHNLPTQTLPPGVTFQDGTRLNFTIHGAGREGYCKDIMLDKIKEIQPDYFGVLLDTFMLFPWITSYNFAPAKSFFYFPSDGGGNLPAGCDQVLKAFNSAVGMSEFAKRQADEVHGLKTHCIPHAVDTGIFRPLSPNEKDELRRDMVVQSYLGNKLKGFLHNKFVVGTVARNQGRKMLDRTLKSFSLFCKDKPDAVLFMHTDIMDGASVFDLRILVERYKLQNRVCFSPIRYFNNFEYKEMNKVYNVMDVFLLTTSGEGFGVPIIEAMSAEIPVMVTDYTTTQELVIDNGQCGFAVPIVAELTGSWAVERGIMNDQACSDLLNQLYVSPKIGQEFGKRGREKVLKLYDWNVVIKQWKAYLQELGQ
jgi:glycosyltransferase involved in cell wall biosynthesis